MSEDVTTTAATTPAAVVRTRGRIAGLEGPRGFGCLCVVLVHCSIHYAPGVLAATRLDILGQALTFFFVLSGFLLYMPFVTRLHDRRERQKTSQYLWHRLRRVFPAYLVTFLIVNFVLRAAYLVNPISAKWDKPDSGTGMITGPLHLLAQLTLTQSLFPSGIQTGINTSWSLSAEWGFYLALPLIGTLLFVFAKNSPHPLRAALWPPAVLLVIGIVTISAVAVLQGQAHLSTVQAYWGPNWIAVLSRSFLGLADNFAFGMIAAVVFVALTNGALSGLTTKRLQWMFFVIMMIGVIASLTLFVLNPRFLPTVFAFAAGAFILWIIAPLARGEHSKVAAVTDWRPMKKMGAISLSAYLVHYPVLIMVDRLGVPIPEGAVGLLIAFSLVAGVTVAIALLSYRFVESPAMKTRA